MGWNTLFGMGHTSSQPVQDFLITSLMWQWNVQTPRIAEEPCAICGQILMLCRWWSKFFVIAIIIRCTDPSHFLSITVAFQNGNPAAKWKNAWSNEFQVTHTCTSNGVPITSNYQMKPYWVYELGYIYIYLLYIQMYPNPKWNWTNFSRYTVDGSEILHHLGCIKTL